MPAPKAGPSELERAREIAQLPGLGGIPISLIQQLLPRLEKPEQHRHSSSWVAGSSSSSQSAGYEDTHTTVMQASAMEAPKLLPASIPESSLLVEQLYEQEQEQEQERQPQTLLLTEETEALNQRDWSSITNVVLDQNAEEPSVVLKGILDHILDFECSCPPPNDVGQSIKFGCSADIDEARMGNIAASVQAGWDDFIDFD